MYQLPRRQRGASALLNIVLLALAAYGIYIGIQYVPIYMEARSMDSVFESLQAAHRTSPITSAGEAQDRVAANLNVNSMDHMGADFQVANRNGNIVVSAQYERELNLVYRKHIIRYQNSLTLF